MEDDLKKKWKTAKVQTHVSKTKNFRDILTIFVVWPPVFMNTKEFLKIKRKHFLQEGPINLFNVANMGVYRNAAFWGVYNTKPWANEKHPSWKTMKSRTG